MPLSKTFSTPASNQKSSRVPCALCGGNTFKPGLDCGDFFYVKCKKCGLLQINPQPLLEEVKGRYNNGGEYLSYELENEKNYLKLQLLALKDVKFDKLEKKLRDPSA
ncbi:MAG: hypothetical protein FWG50_12205 [Kiritimatiellaeota bacterium]|nr:hypothetical protein [Kiritimatiellota bacterium]